MHEKDANTLWQASSCTHSSLGLPPPPYTTILCIVLPINRASTASADGTNSGVLGQDLLGAAGTDWH